MLGTVTVALLLVVFELMLLLTPAALPNVRAAVALVVALAERVTVTPSPAMLAIVAPAGMPVPLTASPT